MKDGVAAETQVQVAAMVERHASALTPAALHSAISAVIACRSLATHRDSRLKVTQDSISVPQIVFSL